MSGTLRQYYRWHSKIYDATRWSFLFGRSALLRAVSRLADPGRILEVGCGTGKNLVALSKLFPKARITGMDLSADMLQETRKNWRRHRRRPDRPSIRLIHAPYPHPLTQEQRYDLVLFSYTLSMIQPDWRQVIGCATAGLCPDGLLAAVDFHDSPVRMFKTWMQINHVRMDSQLLPDLSRGLQTEHLDIRGAYGRAWTYFLYIGRKC